MKFITFLCILFLDIALFADPIKVIVQPDTLHKIDHNVFGHFLERPSWGGEFGIEHAVNKNGRVQRRAVEKLKAMDIPVLRFPGGTDIDYMDWTDMVDLPGRSERPESVGHSGNEVTNRFGIDEYADLATELGCETIIPLNLFDPYLKRVPLDSAALHIVGLVAYTNADTGQTLPEGMRDWPAIRAGNGHPEPFKFKYIQIGNETWALWSWKKSLRDKANIDDPYGWYVECVTRYVDLIEAIDPEIEIIVDYIDSKMQNMLIEALGKRVDYYVFHKYMPWAIKDSNLKKNGQKIAANKLTKEEVWKAIVSTPNSYNSQGMASIGNGLISLARKHDFKIAVTEWNWNGWWETSSPPPFKSLYARSVGVAGFLHGMVRNGDVIKMANQSMLVGSSWGITGIRVHPYGSRAPYYLPTAQMTSFYAKNHGDYLLTSKIENNQTFNQPVKLAGINTKNKVAYVDVLTTGSSDSVSIFFINRDFNEERVVTIDLSAFENMGSSARQVTITGVLSNASVKPPKQPYIYGEEIGVAVENNIATVTLPARSVSVVHLPGELTAVSEKDAAVPESLILKQNYPNPFNPSTSIEYVLTTAGMTRIEIFDIRGRRVKLLTHKNQTAGLHNIEWDGTNDQNIATASGMYILRLSQGQESRSIKLMKLE